jgi:hypothetical protein
VNQWCGHHPSKKCLFCATITLKNFDVSVGPMTKVYTVNKADFAAQMKALSAAGYHTILPAQLRLFMRRRPAKPNHDYFWRYPRRTYTHYAAEMEKYV